MPLEIAVFRNDVPMIYFLLEHGADPDLAEEQPLLLTATRCCGPEVVALFAGQAAKLSQKQKERAFQEVRWGKRPENIQSLPAGRVNRICRWEKQSDFILEYTEMFLCRQTLHQAVLTLAEPWPALQFPLFYKT